MSTQTCVKKDDVVAKMIKKQKYFFKSETYKEIRSYLLSRGFKSCCSGQWFMYETNFFNFEVNIVPEEPGFCYLCMKEDNEFSNFYCFDEEIKIEKVFPTIKKVLGKWNKTMKKVINDLSKINFGE